PPLALSQMRRPHGGHREIYRYPAPTPVSALSRRSRPMKLQFHSPSLGAPHPLPAWCALLAPKPATCFQARLELSPDPTQTTTKPILHALLLAPMPLSEAFLITSTT